MICCKSTNRISRITTTYAYSICFLFYFVYHTIQLNRYEQIKDVSSIMRSEIIPAYLSEMQTELVVIMLWVKRYHHWGCLLPLGMFEDVCNTELIKIPTHQLEYKFKMHHKCQQGNTDQWKQMSRNSKRWNQVLPVSSF